jgi:hypothetical protein
LAIATAKERTVNDYSDQELIRHCERLANAGDNWSYKWVHLNGGESGVAESDPDKGQVPRGAWLDDPRLKELNGRQGDMAVLEIRLYETIGAGSHPPAPLPPGFGKAI